MTQTMQETIAEMWVQYYSKDVEIEETEKELAELKEEWNDAIELASSTIELDWEDGQDSWNTELSELFEQIQDLKRKLHSLEIEKVDCLSFGEWSIADAFVCAIEYNDSSALSRKEEKQMDAFLCSIEEYLKHGHIVWEGESEFEECEITGLRANCSKMKIILRLACAIEDAGQ